jgi:hypothetical protein
MWAGCCHDYLVPSHLVVHSCGVVARSDDERRGERTSTVTYTQETRNSVMTCSLPVFFLSEPYQKEGKNEGTTRVLGTQVIPMTKKQGTTYAFRAAPKR